MSQSLSEYTWLLGDYIILLLVVLAVMVVLLVLVSQVIPHGLIALIMQRLYS